jgi:hypothetical protein
MEMKWRDEILYVLQYPTNDLVHLNTITYSIYPEPESGYAQEDRDGNIMEKPEYLDIQSSHSADDYHMVWHRGTDFLSSYCIDDETIRNMPSFWQTVPEEEGDLGIPLFPVIAVADHLSNKYFGIGYDKYNVGGVQDHPYICYGEVQDAEDGQGKVVSVLHVNSDDFSKRITEWGCLDVSMDSSLIFVGGHKDGVGVLGAINFDPDMKSVKFVPVDSQGRAKTISSIRRFKGTNILLSGAIGFVFVHSFADKNFTPVKTFQVSDCGPIQEIRVTPSRMFLMDEEGNIFMRITSCKTNFEQNWQLGSI